MPDQDPRDDRPADHPVDPSFDEPLESASDPDHIPRARTLVRIGLSIVSILLVRIAESVLVATVIFELLFTLVTERPPTGEVRRFANRVLSYLVSIARYLTYESESPPFPFSELPPELDYTPKPSARA